MSKEDNVAVAMVELPAGKTLDLDGKPLKILQKIDFGHKFAIRDIKKGEKIMKYGEVIGVAGSDIRLGEHVHVHNVESMRGGKNHRA